MDLSSLTNAVQGQLNLNTPTSPYPELAQFYASRMAQPAQELRNAGAGYNEKVNQENAQKDLQVKLSRTQDKLDKSKYRKVRKADGGFDFFDPEGNQVDIATYSQITGDRPVDIVSGSENPIDTQFVEDYSNLQNYISAIRDGDTASAEAMRKENPALSQYDNEGGIDRLIQDFRKYYQRYYVTRQQNPNAWGTRPGNSLFYSPSYANARLDASAEAPIGG